MLELSSNNVVELQAYSTFLPKPIALMPHAIMHAG